jgi:DNA-directed RNA polymerase subunit H (RpoH/RPB5)
MLTNRKILKNDINSNYKKLLESDKGNYIFTLSENDFKLAVNIIPYKITALNKSYGLLDFADKYKNYHRIVIVKEISKKVVQHIILKYGMVEVFAEKELMINLVDHHLVPKHEVLSDEKAKEVLDSYLLKKRQLPIIYTSDPVARYYNMKVGQICRITRPSDKSGLSVAYRIVVKGNVEK